MSNNGGTPKRQGRRQSSNPFASKNRARGGSNKVKYDTFKQEQAGSSIFHELDPSGFPISKQSSMWMQSSETDNCSICLTKIDSQIFGTKKRHCKKCGRVVCIPCSGIRIRNSRVCTQCNAYYLTLNNLLNQWYRTNRSITHSLCGYDAYTLETCSSLKRTLFILNHYQECLLLKKDGHHQLSQKREFQRMPKPGHTPSEHSRNMKVAAPFDITHIKIKQFIDRLPKYDSKKFIDDIHHLKQMHFKKSEVFKITQYEKKHQWEIRAYSWKKIGKCDRYGCPYGIKDVRNKDKGQQHDHQSGGDAEHKQNDQPPDGNPSHRKNPSIINMDQDIPNILNNMHVVLLHGVDDADHALGKRDSGVQELYDLLPSTPMSPHKSEFHIPFPVICDFVGLTMWFMIRPRKFANS